MTYKMIFGAKRRAGMSREDFARYWTTTHAEVAKRVPGIARYVINLAPDLSGSGREQAYGLLAIADGRPDAARTHLLGALQAFAPTQMVDIFLRTLGMFAGIVTPSAATRLAELANEVRTQRLPMLEAVEIVQDVLDL